jgi:multiple sugar transport system permease protein
MAGAQSAQAPRASRGLVSRVGAYLSSPDGREARLGYGFILIWIIGFLAFELGPLISVFFYSLTSYDVFSPPKWVGLANYQRIFTNDPLFWTSLGNTAIIVMVAAPVRLALALAIALLLNQKIRGIGIFRTAIYIPMIVPVAATAVLWAWILDPRLGILNYMLNGLGIPSAAWMVTEAWSKPAIMVVTMWRIGEPVVLFLAGLQAIPQDLYEAADIDGAGWWTKLFRITVPMLSPTLFMLLVLECIELFQTFVWPYAMTKGGPLNSSISYVMYIFQRAFEDFRIGYASALAVILFAVILVFTLALFKWSKSWVHSAVD